MIIYMYMGKVKGENIPLRLRRHPIGQTAHKLEQPRLRVPHDGRLRHQLAVDARDGEVVEISSGGGGHGREHAVRVAGVDAREELLAAGVFGFGGEGRAEGGVCCQGREEVRRVGCEGGVEGEEAVDALGVYQKSGPCGYDMVEHCSCRSGILHTRGNPTKTLAFRHASRILRATAICSSSVLRPPRIKRLIYAHRSPTPGSW